MVSDPTEQLRDALRDGTHTFWPPFMGEAVLELVERVEALEAVLTALGFERVGVSP